jgi:large subunit ribosomal protein L18
MKINTKKDRRARIALRQRKRIAGTAERPRLRVFRSVSHVYAQVIDDMSGTTIVSAASTEPALKPQLGGPARPGNKAGAQLLGRTIAERLIAKGIKRVVFDRGGFLYHGRIRAIAEAAREAGLEF